MSFFPQPDPVKLQTAMVQNYTIYHPSQTHSRRSRAAQPAASQWPSSTSSSSSSSSTAAAIADHCPPSHPASWAREESRGLGLMNLPVSSEGYYGGSNTVTSSDMADSMVWTSNANMVTGSGIARKDSAIDHCHPLSTLLPASAVWSTMPNAAHTTMLHGHETSPGRSEHSTVSSRPSVVSSPYTRSDSVYQAAHSPAIKIEDPTEASGSGYHYGPSSLALDRSMLVHPGDLLGDASMSTTGDDMTSYLATSRDVMKIECDTSSNYGSYERSRASSHASQATSYDSSYDDQRPQKRSFTTPANSTCACERCGKLFQRSYNLKAHMETHDPNRDQPHVCEYPSCRRKFVRRTDLQRHEQSVHLKIRNFPCPMCDASFARKDTLRRHVEDGCPKRPEVKKRGSRPSGARRRSHSQTSSHAVNINATASYTMDPAYAGANMGPYY